MPKVAKELGPLAVSRLGPGVHAVGGVAGLLLQVSGGASSWLLRYRVGGLRREMGLGPYPEVTLAKAREAAAAARETVRAGGDPLQARQEARQAAVAARRAQRTLADLLPDFLAQRTAGLKNVKHAAQWESTLKTYCGNLMLMPASSVTSADVAQALSEVWVTKPETARRVRGRLEALLGYATAKGARPEGINPASLSGSLREALPARRARKQGHHATLPLELLPAFYARLKGLPGTAAQALRFALLTAARSGEVRGADWSELDLSARLWKVPADRMKAGRAHTVSLSDEAVTLLESLPHREGLVFPAAGGGQLSDMALAAVVRRLNRADKSRWVDTDGRAAVPHGIARAGFKSWASERTDTPVAIVEAALAHAAGDKIEAAYQRSDFNQRRAVLMAQWGDFLSGKVVNLADAARRKAKA